MEIKLDDRHYLMSDPYCCWIEQERRSGKSGKLYRVKVSGYHNTIDQAFESFIKKKIGGSTADTIEDLVLDVQETLDVVRKMCANIDIKTLEAIQ